LLLNVHGYEEAILNTQYNQILAFLIPIILKQIQRKQTWANFLFL
jgi:hypothetical protein